MANKCEVQTPMQPGLILKQTTMMSEEDKIYMSDIPYMNMVSALWYAANCTYPDISFATRMFACFLMNPGIEHYNAVKYCFKYLKAMKEKW